MIEILQQDQDYIAVNKPAGLLVHRTNLAAQESEALLQIVAQQVSQKLYPVHRLDRPTSGIVLFALSSESARNLSDQFAQGKVEKKYLALVRGYAKSLVLDYPLLEELDKISDRKAQKTKPAQSAVTEFQVLKTCEIPVAVDRYPTSRYSLVQALPKTGRKHQIRRHLKHLHHPVVGDVNHGSGKHNRFFKENFGVSRMLLACTELAFEHPRTKSRLKIQAPLCDEFQKVIAELPWN